MTSQNRGAASILLSPLLLSVECALLEQSHVPAMLKVHWWRHCRLFQMGCNEGCLWGWFSFVNLVGKLVTQLCWLLSFNASVSFLFVVAVLVVLVDNPAQLLLVVDECRTRRHFIFLQSLGEWDFSFLSWLFLFYVAKKGIAFVVHPWGMLALWFRLLTLDSAVHLVVHHNFWKTLVPESDALLVLIT